MKQKEQETTQADELAARPPETAEGNERHATAEGNERPATAEGNERPATAEAEAQPQDTGFAELTAGERETVVRYATADPEIRKTIIAEYLASIRAENEFSAPRVLSGGAGTPPALPPRNPRSLYEAGQIAEAMFRAK